MTNFLRVIPFRLNVLLKVFLIAVEVFCAGQRVLEQDEHGKEHLRCHLSINSLELIQVDALFCPEDLLEQVRNLLLVLKPIQEYLTIEEKTQIIHNNNFISNVI